MAKLCKEMVIEETPEKWEWIRTTRFGFGIDTVESDDSYEGKSDKSYDIGQKVSLLPFF